MYGESSGGKFFDGPVLLNSLITIENKSDGTSEFGVDFSWSIKVAFLRDDLVDVATDTQYFAGKDPQYPYAQNPLNPGLENFGYNVSLVCNAHYIPADRINIIKQRL